METMTQENKDLLLKDLCARLPYGVKMNHIADDEHCPQTLIGIAKDMITLSSSAGYSCVDVEHYKPYLFPLSSMTEEQKRELRQMDAFISTFGDICFAMYDEYGHDIIPTYEDAIQITNWCNKNHFDYRGLIPKGIANDATGLNIY